VSTFSIRTHANESSRRLIDTRAANIFLNAEEAIAIVGEAVLVSLTYCINKGEKKLDSFIVVKALRFKVTL
jgi:hypothetical protein